MTIQKHALVVDDSKSARLVLRRMLEKHEIEVETVDSAAAALDYLSSHRPDVVFMDHMMPGTDGFEAVRAIKNNPQTATIPVMMYTSKGGDLYLGQARALGAVGVLPKTVAPAELYGSLKRLGLVEERRRSVRQTGEVEASERAEDLPGPEQGPPAAAFVEPGMRSSAPPAAAQLNEQLRALLDEQRVEIRKDVLLSMETVARQTGSRIAKDLEDRLEIAGDRHPPERSLTVPLMVVTLLLLASMAWNLFMHRRQQEAALAAANETQVAVPQQAEEAVARLKALQAQTLDLLTNSWKAVGWAMNQSLVYPYDELALDLQRQELVQQLLEKLGEAGYRGKVTLETHAGEFCLMGDQDTGFRLPPPDVSVDQCDFIGNPVQPTDSPAAHQSLAFANFVNSTPLLEQDDYQLEIVSGSRREPLFAYPPRSAETSASAWNMAAALNNRVTIKLEPQQP